MSPETPQCCPSCSKYRHDTFVFQCSDPWHTAPVPAEPYREEKIGDYSCAVCGFGMLEPCEHWKRMLAQPKPAAAPTGTPRDSSPITNQCVEACKADKYHAYGCPNDRDLVIRPTETGEGSEPFKQWYETTFKDWGAYGAWQKLNDLRSQLEGAKHAFQQAHLWKMENAKRADKAERDLATAQARIARLEQALRFIQTLAKAPNLTESWIDVEQIACAALAEPQSGDTK